MVCVLCVDTAGSCRVCAPVMVWVHSQGVEMVALGMEALAGDCARHTHTQIYLNMNTHSQSLPSMVCCSFVRMGVQLWTYAYPGGGLGGSGEGGAGDGGGGRGGGDGGRGGGGGGGGEKGGKGAHGGDGLGGGSGGDGGGGLGGGGDGGSGDGGGGGGGGEGGLGGGGEGGGEGEGGGDGGGGLGGRGGDGGLRMTPCASFLAPCRTSSCPAPSSSKSAFAIVHRQLECNQRSIQLCGFLRRRRAVLPIGISSASPPAHASPALPVQADDMSKKRLQGAVSPRVVPVALSETKQRIRRLMSAACCRRLFILNLSSTRIGAQLLCVSRCCASELAIRLAESWKPEPGPGSSAGTCHMPCEGLELYGAVLVTSAV